MFNLVKIKGTLIMVFSVSAILIFLRQIRWTTIYSKHRPWPVILAIEAIHLPFINKHAQEKGGIFVLSNSIPPNVPRFWTWAIKIKTCACSSANGFRLSYSVLPRLK